jgi:hypothetical protein
MGISFSTSNSAGPAQPEKAWVGIYRAHFANFILDLLNCYSQPLLYIGFVKSCFFLAMNWGVSMHCPKSKQLQAYSKLYLEKFELQKSKFNLLMFQVQTWKVFIPYFPRWQRIICTLFPELLFTELLTVYKFNIGLPKLLFTITSLYWFHPIIQNFCEIYILFLLARNWVVSSLCHCNGKCGNIWNL